MRNVILGRTGLKVGTAGLGCGGKSRIGRAKGESLNDAVRLIHEALDLGVNYFDNSEAYGTEEVVGHALHDRREGTVIATKVVPRTKTGELIDAQAFREHVEGSLVRLQTDTIDVLQLHGVRNLKEYDQCVSELLPEMERLHDKGMIRFLGLSEYFTTDWDHVVLRKAKFDSFWDVMLVGFNILNPSARELVLPQTIKNDVGFVVMFAVRHVFSHPDALKNLFAKIAEEGLIDTKQVDLNDPLGFLIHEGGADTIVDAAYRFAVHEPGCHVVLTGTGNIEHLRENVKSINSPPLPMADLKQLHDLFGHLAHFAGD